MTLAIAHRENGRVVLDLVREKAPPFSPDQVTAEFCQTLKAYRCSSVTGDQYAGEWPRERFRLHGVEYRPAPLTKSEMYKALLPEINSGKVELLDHPRLLNQLLQLERRTGAGGRETIDHPPRRSRRPCQRRSRSLPSGLRLRQAIGRAEKTFGSVVINLNQERKTNGKSETVDNSAAASVSGEA